ncbi:novel acetylcholine receptor chaperone [Adelges cooleyi]|uniref:novel acetylcholine receptor chaperone n=1 Tax=Adelges cooleyi TaxID=133065 RepID=UPI0021808939|nr:novel acetylcholine receptor chaperone [Adelges cooleyi]XP_050422164.1 novel acetylcholine receptor chaperone [Adelges cooleyi]
MGSIVLKSLSVLLGVFFLFVGTMKISPVINKELHKDLRKDYVSYAKVFPLSKMIDFKVPAKWYRRTVGAIEVFSGACLAFIPIRNVKNGANITLLLSHILAVYTHWAAKDKFDRMAPSLVFLFMLAGRLVIDYQIKRKERLESAEAKTLKQE